MAKMEEDLDLIIKSLEAQGIDANTTEEQVVGLGDIIEQTLTKFGITQERFKEFFGLNECNCTKRKKFLNGIFSWKVKKSS